jgi:hypothetical protein
VWHDDDGACRTNSRNEVFNQGLVPGSYVVTVQNYASGGGGTPLLAVTITCPETEQSITPGGRERECWNAHFPRVSRQVRHASA